MKISDVKKLTPIDRWLYWIRERESIRLKKESGRQSPWTDDEILDKYRFTNVRRMDDKVSRWLLEHWYEPFKNHPNMLYACALARFINLPKTLNKITDLVFRRIQPPLFDQIKVSLNTLKKNGPIFNGAYMVRSDSGVNKVDYVVDLCVSPLKDKAINPSSMQESHQSVMGYGIGSFMAGQIVADLRWAVEGDWADAKTWAPIGVGSARGLSRLKFGHKNGKITQRVFDQELPKLIEIAEEQVRESITSRLEAIDYQNTLCEYDKHERALHNEGSPKQLYRH